MELGPQIRSETPPLGDRTTHTPATRPSSRSSACRAGIPCRSSPLTLPPDLGGAPTGARRDDGCAHPSQLPVTVATTRCRSNMPASVTRVLLQPATRDLDRGDGVDGVSRDKRLAEGQHQRAQRAFADDVEPALLLHRQLHPALMPDGVEKRL